MKIITIIIGLALSPSSFVHAASSAPKALLFDVMGTCVEIESSLITQGEKWGKAHNIVGDWKGFAEAWISDHETAVEQIREGQLNWLSIDAIHQRNLSDLATQYLNGLKGTDLSEINQFWHHLSPWPDSQQGFQRLLERFKLVAFSNADLNLLKDMSLSAGMPWDEYVSADEVQHYKPDTEFYLYAEKKLRLKPEEMMLVAAHVYDVEAAQKLGWQTALIERPGEDNYEGVDGNFDYIASDLVELARQMDGQQVAIPHRPL